jgi:hypothetical protein
METKQTHQTDRCDYARKMRVIDKEYGWGIYVFACKELNSVETEHAQPTNTRRHNRYQKLSMWAAVVLSRNRVLLLFSLFFKAQ